MMYTLKSNDVSNVQIMQRTDKEDPSDPMEMKLNIGIVLITSRDMSKVEVIFCMCAAQLYQATLFALRGFTILE